MYILYGPQKVTSGHATPSTNRPTFHSMMSDIHSAVLATSYQAALLIGLFTLPNHVVENLCSHHSQLR